ncbi:hypothetical protein L218DRAFT_160510 [Marasmius fiardii PR-910]|nr:hypothetical protein L218DRAFT_160510 [Marasmius fiardii PR-910]
MGTFDDPIGSVLIGTWLSTMLEVLIIEGTINYFVNHPKDPLWKKVLIAVTVIVDFASLITAYATVYLASVTYWGNTVAISRQFWSIPTCLWCTGIVTALVQGFLIHRAWVLSRGRNWFVLVLLAVISLTAFACITASGAIITKYPRYVDRYHGTIPIIIWLSTTTTADIGITAVLVFWFYRAKTSFKHTESIIQRLIGVSLQTGGATCALAIGTLISYIINTASNIEASLTFVLCRVYVLTLLYNVNVRLSPNHEQDHILQSTRNHERYVTDLAPAVTFSEIQVHRTVHVDEDSSDVKKTVRFNGNQTESDRESVVKA